MGFRINTNIAAMNAHKNATQNNLGLDKSLNSLSSGLRINNSADDSAGLAIANQLAAQSSGLGQAVRNSNDGIGLIQTADGALEEYGNILQRVRVLASQAANDTQDDVSRSYIQTEVTKLMESADDIATTTKFNGKALLDGQSGGLNNGEFLFHVGAYANQTQAVTIGDAQVSNLAGSTGYVAIAAVTAVVAVSAAAAITANATAGVSAVGAISAVAAVTGIAGEAASVGFSVTSQGRAELTIASMDAAIVTINGERANIGAAQNKLESTVRNISATQVNISAAESNIRDVDFASESANFAKHNILAQSGSYAMSQANAVQQNVMRLLQ